MIGADLGLRSGRRDSRAGLEPCFLATRSHNESESPRGGNSPRYGRGADREPDDYGPQSQRASDSGARGVIRDPWASHRADPSLPDAASVAVDTGDHPGTFDGIAMATKGGRRGYGAHRRSDTRLRPDGRSGEAVLFKGRCDSRWCLGSRKGRWVSSVPGRACLGTGHQGSSPVQLAFLLDASTAHRPGVTQHLDMGRVTSPQNAYTTTAGSSSSLG
jgi:hypothetical protein